MLFALNMGEYSSSGYILQIALHLNQKTIEVLRKLIREEKVFVTFEPPSTFTERLSLLARRIACY